MSSSRILQPGIARSFSQYFDMPFTIEDILAEFEFTLQRETIELPETTKLLDLSALGKELRRNRNHIELVNETARREALISPILFEVADVTNQRINVEYSIAVNEHLKGTVDYFLPSHNLLVIEAKQSDLVRGFTQLAVEMVALDQWTRSDTPRLYGIVTTGEDWQFGVLERSAKVVIQDPRRLRVPEELEELVRFLVGILE
jgi:hypothetical protein